MDWSWFRKEVAQVRCANSERCSFHRTEGCEIATDGVWLVTEKVDGQEESKNEQVAAIRKRAPCNLRRIREWVEDPKAGQGQLSGVDVHFDPKFT